MRVGMVCPYSLCEPGGVQEQVLGLAAALRRRGHQVEVIAPGTPPPDTTAHSMGRAFRIRVNGSIAPMAPHPAAAARTVRLIRHGRFDVLHLHEPFAPSITIPALLASSTPLVATFHAAGDRTPYRWFGSSLHRLAARIDLRVAVSESAAELARRHLRGSYEILYNGVDLKRFTGEPTDRAARPTVLFLGRHEHRKGLDILLTALRLLPPDVALAIAGEGEATADLRQRHWSDPRIEWVGRLTDTAKIRHLRAASVLCVPSRYGESFGMVLLEAMAAGTPVVASDLPGYRSITNQGHAALLVPPEDPRALAQALEKVLFDRRLAGELRERGHQFAQHFSLDTLALRYSELYRHVAEVASPALSHQVSQRGTSSVRRPGSGSEHVESGPLT